MTDKERQLDDFFGVDSNGKGHHLKEGIRETISRSTVHRSRWRLFPKILSPVERRFFGFFIILIIGSLISIPFTSYYHLTSAAPDEGDSFIEGVVGEPRYLNPLLATGNTDKDLVSLIYSSLLKYNGDGKLVPDLAKSYEISADGLVYTVYLRDDVRWHDGASFTADDVTFTVRTAQNKDYGTLNLINWQGVEVEKIGTHALLFRLKNRYAQFLNNLTLRIMPHHQWENIQPINFPLSELNLKPIGTGPYVFERFQKDENGRVISYDLESNSSYYSQEPYISSITFHFYNSEDEMIEAYNRNDIDNISSLSPRNLSKIKFKQRLAVREIDIPLYFSVFFNQNQSKTLADKNVRLALSHATDRSGIIEKSLQGHGKPVQSPMLSSLLGNPETADLKSYNFDPSYANQILEAGGWIRKEGEAIRSKGNDKLSFRLVVPTLLDLQDAADELKRQWAEVGVELNVETLNNQELQQVISRREYEMLLFGEILHPDSDPFSLWHSSQRNSPGFNLALYNNKSVDTLLEEARQTINPTDRMKKYDDFQRLILEDIPAIFLYTPTYLYPQTKEIKGFSNRLVFVPSERFSLVEQWYIDEKRVW